jgi:RNA polymerase sigma-70 factor (ECF subfamily)
LAHVWQISRVDRAAKPRGPWDLPSSGEKAGVADAELCRRTRLGDAEAFHVIFQRHGPAVRRFLASALRDDADSDEALQETFVRAHARMAALNEPDRLRWWLLGIARIVALDAHSWRRRQAEREEEHDRAGVVELDPTPEAVLLDAEAERVLAREIDGLLPHRRAALMLRVDHGLGYPQIAETMGWPLQKVKNEIHRARLQIRARILRYLRGGK